jgi:hypothetical protein
MSAKLEYFGAAQNFYLGKVFIKAQIFTAGRAF